jgi:chaperonin GroES
MKLKPLSDHVLVKLASPATMTAGGLHIPEDAQEKARHGEILAVGPGRLVPFKPGEGPAPEGGYILTPLAVKPGDVVLIGKHTGSAVLVDGVEHFIVREDEILGVVEEP